MERALTTAWFDEQNRLTPDELQTVTFPMSRLGRRGYEEEPVRAFLRRCTRSSYAGERAGVVVAGSPAAAQADHRREKQPVISNEVLFGARTRTSTRCGYCQPRKLTADRYVADAQAYSSRVTEEARLAAMTSCDEAQQHSDMILEDASSQGPRGGGFRR